jgi:hypothetical protein
MPVATFPTQPPTATCSVAFASVNTLSWALREAAWKALDLGLAVPFTALQLSFDPESEALKCLRPDNTWITARADVLRLFHPRPVLAALAKIGNAGAINSPKQELS